jgi:hypothetical protein
LQAVNLSNYDGPVARLKIPVSIIGSEVISIGDTRHICDDDFLVEYWGFQADAIGV